LKFATGGADVRAGNDQARIRRQVLGQSWGRLRNGARRQRNQREQENNNKNRKSHAEMLR
jgi:hypothetical protein